MVVGAGDIDARITRLEREARVWKAAAILSVLVAAIAWVVPSVSAQSQTQTLTADAITVDTIHARLIQVSPYPPTAPPREGLGEGLVTIVAGESGSSILMSGSAVSLQVGTNDSNPRLVENVDAQSATLWAYDASHAAVSMGLMPGAPGAFRVYGSQPSIVSGFTNGKDPFWFEPWFVP
jgi:hypothetical protein